MTFDVILMLDYLVVVNFIATILEQSRSSKIVAGALGVFIIWTKTNQS